MEFEVMKKKLDTYRKPNGQFKQVGNDLLVELLRMWEADTGPSQEFTRKLGIRSKQMGSLIRSARKIVTSAEAADPAFHALQIQGGPGAASEPASPGIEVIWGSDKVIRFPNVDLLLDFLRRAS